MYAQTAKGHNAAAPYKVLFWYLIVFLFAQQDSPLEHGRHDKWEHRNVTKQALF